MDRTSACIENFHMLFHCDPFPKNCDDAEMMEILQKYIFGEVFQAGDLSVRERELITVTVLAALQTLPQLKAHLNAALNAGATPEELHESLYQLSAFIGFPRTLNALGVFAGVLKDRGLSLPQESTVTVTEETRLTHGMTLEVDLFKEALYGVTNDLPACCKEQVHSFIRAFGLGDLFTRKGLELAERTMLALVCLTALSADESLERGVKAAISAGNTKEELAWALVQAMPYTGFPAALMALKILQRAAS